MISWRLKVTIVFVIGILVILGSPICGDSQSEISQPPSGKGKTLVYTATRFGVPILKATIKIEDGFVDQGKSLLQVQAFFYSLHYLGLVFRMNNRFTSTVEAKTCSPVRYVKEVDQEGLLIKNKHYLHTFTFDALHQKVVAEKVEKKEKEEIVLPPDTYDPLSMFARFYLREDLRPGEDIRMSIYDGVRLRQMVFHSKIERVKSKMYGEVEAVCLESTTSFSSFGEKEGIIRIWYIKDGEKTPISMELDLPIGDVKFELESIERS
jgi:Protein of unknown function (DUF3108)